MDPILVRAVLVVTGVLVLGVLAGYAKARQGRVTAGVQEAALTGNQLQELGLDLAGARAGAVLLGSPTCAPCVQVKAVLGELEREQAGFRWVDVDAADHLELVGELRIMRVPTLLLLDPSGRILAKVSGVPRAQALREVLAGDAAHEKVA